MKNRIFHKFQLAGWFGLMLGLSSVGDWTNIVRADPKVLESHGALLTVLHEFNGAVLYYAKKIRRINKYPEALRQEGKQSG